MLQPKIVDDTYAIELKLNKLKIQTICEISNNNRNV